MNKIHIIGGLGKDPIFSATSEGLEIAKFSVGVTRKRDREKTDWFNCTCFGTIVTKLIKPFVHKGSKLAISGPFQFEEYEKDGEKRYSNGIIVEELELLSSQKPAEQVAEESSENEKIAKFDPIDPDDLPF